MSTIEQTLNAGVPVTFPGGEQFHLLEAINPVDITFYDSRNKPIETWEAMKAGFRIVFEKGFIQVRLESATGQTVKVGITSGRGEYDRSQGDVDATLTKAGYISSLVDVDVGPAAAINVISPNPQCRVVYISSLTTNINTVRVGYNVDANQGIPLAPGETIAISTAYTVRAYNPAGAITTLAVTYTND